jgi:hypothetical protein
MSEVNNTPPQDISDIEDQGLVLSWRAARRAEYNDLNQFELLSDDAINGTNTYAEAIQAIKNKYPKPDYDS